MFRKIDTAGRLRPASKKSKGTPMRPNSGNNIYDIFPQLIGMKLEALLF